jgi:hypothetical protein
MDNARNSGNTQEAIRTLLAPGRHVPSRVALQPANDNSRPVVTDSDILYGEVLVNPAPRQRGRAETEALSDLYRYAPELYSSSDPRGAYELEQDKFLPGWFTMGATPGSIVHRRADFTAIGTRKSLRSVSDYLDATTVHDDQSPLLAVVGADLAITFAAPTAAAIGFCITFGAPILDYVPFDMTVATSNFVCAGDPHHGSASSVNRLFTIRCADLRGGNLFVPFGYRRNPSMQYAMHKAAVIDPAVGTASIVLSGIPAALLPTLVANVQLATAHSDTLMQFGRLMKIRR